MSLYEFGLSFTNYDLFHLREANVNHDSIYIFGRETINRLIYICLLIGDKLDRQISYRLVKISHETLVDAEMRDTAPPQCSQLAPLLV